MLGFSARSSSGVSYSVWLNVGLAEEVSIKSTTYVFILLKILLFVCVWDAKRIRSPFMDMGNCSLN